MRRIDEFRIYYNHTIYPELLRTELERKRIIRLFGLSIILVVALTAVELYFNVFILTLIGLIPLIAYFSWLIVKAYNFRRTFKPRIVKLLLDFLDDRLNYGEFGYSERKFLPKQEFLSSRIFKTRANYYEGEDFISGEIGSIKFRLCEIRVQDHSPVDGKVREVFKGIFVRTKLQLQQERAQGTLLILPKERRQQLEGSIKSILDEGGENLMRNPHDAPFANRFDVYANDTPQDMLFEELIEVEEREVIPTRELLTVSLQQLIANYVAEYDKELFISIINQEVYLLITEPANFLEPYLFRPNSSFELIRDFYKDLELVVQIIEDFDRIY
ncbi:MAG: DUF3137 domain-containing protein [Bacteroidota bacterium]